MTLGKSGTSIHQSIFLSIVCIVGEIICGTILTDLQTMIE